MNVLAALLRHIKDHPEDDVPRLVLADWLEEHGPELTSLDLGARAIGDDGVKLLVASPYLANLASLDLDYNGLSNDGVEALARSSHLVSLTSLNLWGNGISAGGARALAESPGLNNLADLHLAGNAIGWSCQEELQRFGKRVCF
jgi:uncharacterized protein (TIGR02996 family)